MVATRTTTAFTCRPPAINAIQYPTIGQRLHSSISEEELATLLDDAILLYSVVGYRPQSSDESVSDEVKQLRKTEVVSLVEDMVLASSSSSVTTILQESKELSSQTKERAIEDMSLVELSQLLDRAIMIGYQSTYTQEELDAWTQRIEKIQVVFDAKMAQQTTSTKPYAAPEAEKTGPTISDFETRLGQLQTVIPAPSTWNITNIATPVLLKNVALNTFTSSIKTEPKSLSQDKVEGGAIIEVDATHTDGEYDSSDKSSPVEADCAQSVSETLLDHQSQEVAQDAATETPNRSKEVVVQNSGERTVDALSAALSAAAAGVAAAAQHIPNFAAGVVKESIAYARTAFETRQDESSAAEGGSKSD